MKWQWLPPALLLATAGCNQAPQSGGNTASAAGVITTNNTVLVPNTAPPPAAATKPAEPVNSYIRAAHVVPGAGPVSLTADDKTLVRDVGYGNASTFVAVPPGKHQVFALASNGKHLSGPMPVELDPGEDVTVTVNGVPGDVAMIPFKHKSHGPVANRCKVAFLHSAKGLPPLDVKIDGKLFRGYVSYGMNTDYQELAPGRHTMRIEYVKTLPATAAPTPSLIPGATPLTPPAPAQAQQSVSLTQQLDLAPGKVYSVVIFYYVAKLPRLLTLDDRFAAELIRAPAAGTKPPPAPR